MRLIQLSAFGGRLVSAPIEWPDEPPEIRMLVSQETFSGNFRMGVEFKLDSPIQRIARFTPTGRYAIIPGVQSAVAIYELVGM